jgi:hypothetical protein
MSPIGIIFGSMALLIVASLVFDTFSKRVPDKKVSLNNIGYSNAPISREEIQAELTLLLKDSGYSFSFSEEGYSSSNKFYTNVEIYKIVDGIKFAENLSISAEQHLRHIPTIKQWVQQSICIYQKELETQRLRELIVKEYEQHPYCLSPKKQEALRLAKEKVEQFNEKYKPVSSESSNLTRLLAENRSDGMSDRAVDLMNSISKKLR